MHVIIIYIEILCFRAIFWFVPVELNWVNFSKFNFDEFKILYPKFSILNAPQIKNYNSFNYQKYNYLYKKRKQDKTLIQNNLDDFNNYISNIKYNNQNNNINNNNKKCKIQKKISDTITKYEKFISFEYCTYQNIVDPSKLLRIIDETAAIVAIKHTNWNCVTGFIGIYFKI